MARVSRSSAAQTADIRHSDSVPKHFSFALFFLIPIMHLRPHTRDCARGGI